MTTTRLPKITKDRRYMSDDELIDAIAALENTEVHGHMENTIKQSRLERFYGELDLRLRVRP